MKSQDMIDVIFAHMQGKTIQYRTLANGKAAHWDDCADNGPCWEFTVTEYRVKPPKPKAWIVRQCDNTLCYDDHCIKNKGSQGCHSASAPFGVREII